MPFPYSVEPIYRNIAPALLAQGHQFFVAEVLRAFHGWYKLAIAPAF